MESTLYSLDATGNVMSVYEYQVDETSPNFFVENFTLQEQPIYGSSRLGYRKVDKVLYSHSYSVSGGEITTLGETEATLADLDHTKKISGLKAYQLSNHLGNVLAVVGDRLVPLEDGTPDNFADYFKPEVLTVTDYYPFGMIMPGRNEFSDNYRYGFNGMEKDDEITGATGTSYTAEFWQYDSRLGRRWNVDPVVKPWFGSYGTFSNNPIIMVDPEGDDDFLSLADGTIERKKTDDKTHSFKYVDADGNVSDMGTFSYNNHGLIALPSSYEKNGISFKYTGSADENYISAEALAGLFGALMKSGTQGLALNHWSNSDGSSPSPSVSHKKGNVGDLRPLRTDKSGDKVLVSAPEFDKEANTKLISALKDFGWTSILSEKSGDYITPGTTHYNGYWDNKKGKWVSVRHNNHFHAQKYAPKIKIVNELSVATETIELSLAERCNQNFLSSLRKYREYKQKGKYSMAQIFYRNAMLLQELRDTAREYNW